MPPAPNPPQLSRVLFWLSMLVLIAGARVLIDPSGRKTNSTVEVYIAMAAFELYMWLLLALGRWQSGKTLNCDVARSGLFAVVLQGLQFVAVNQLHQAAPTCGLTVAAAAMALAVTKLLLAPKWLGVSVPRIFKLVSVGWLIVIAVPGPVMRDLLVEEGQAQWVGYASCWGVALLLALHIPLAVWQRRQGFAKSATLLKQWQPAWVLSLGLGIMAVVQLYANRWGLFSDWPYWYITPVYLAGAAAGVILAFMTGKLTQEAIVAAVLAGGHWMLTLPRPGSLEWPQAGQWAAQIFVHPLFTPGLFAVILVAAMAWALRQRWLYLLAAGGPVAYVMVRLIWAVRERITGIIDWLHEAIAAMLDKRIAQGIALIVLSFLLLGAGALVQWLRQQNRVDLPPPTAPSPPPEEDDEQQGRQEENQGQTP